jgi:radical SAM protein with 4Fe4S-binding SPASM domain
MNTYQSMDHCIADLHLKYNVVGHLDFRVLSIVDFVNIAIQLKSLRKDCYQPKERIIVTIDRDFYDQDFAGIGLQSLQILINDVDISNYFIELVTTNSQIFHEYSWVLQNLSNDATPFNLNLCTGEYTRLPNSYNGTKISKFIKYQSINNDILSFENLSTHHRDLLQHSSSFCMAPWTHLAIQPNGKVKPCCDNQTWLGDCSTQTLKETWNSEPLKQIRRDLLANKKVESCKSCYIKEDLGRDSLRQSINRSMAQHIDKVDQTVDGYLESFELNYFDIRFNNLCNLACRSCSPTYSSSWHQVAVALGKINKSTPALIMPGDNSTDVYEQIMEHIDSVDKIYFAGGEPLITDQCYMILDELDRRQRHDVHLVYNTNFTRVHYQGRSVFDIWAKFKSVSVCASLDGEHSRAEYVRSGTKWETVIKNRQEMIKHCPDVDFSISSTVSILNALHLPDFHKSWVESGLIQPEDYNIQLLFGPDYLRVDKAPQWLKQQITEKYQDHLKWLLPLDKLGRACYGFNSVLKYIDNFSEFDSEIFWKEVDQLDHYYGTDLIATFPELKNLKNQ